MFWLVWSCCACVGLAPRAPLLLVGGRRHARGGAVCDEDAGLCVVQERGCRPVPQLKQSKGTHRWWLMFIGAWGSSGLVDKQNGVRREQARATPTPPTSFFFFLSLPARQHLPGSGVRVAPSCVAVCLQGYCLCSTHGAPSMALDQGGGFGMCALSVVPFLGFIFRAGTLY